MIRVVIDTNVVLSGLIKPDSVPGRVLRAWRDGSFRFALSEFLLEEIAVTLARSKIQALVPWPATQIHRFVLELRAFCDLVSSGAAAIRRSGGRCDYAVPSACSARVESDTQPKMPPCALIISSATRWNSGK